MNNFNTDAAKVISTCFDDDYIGTCIEIGAGDGVIGSNTLYFERKGWKCLCIEPNPVYKDKLSIRSLVDMCAIGSKHGIMPLHVFRVLCPPDLIHEPGHQYGALTALETDKRLLEHFVGNGHIRERYDVDVIVKTLTQCVEEHELTDIDFISLDTEGTELDVLKSFDIEKYNIPLWVIENNYVDNTANADYLKQFGYKLWVRNDVDEYFIKESEIK